KMKRCFVSHGEFAYLGSTSYPSVFFFDTVVSFNGSRWDVDKRFEKGLELEDQTRVLTTSDLGGDMGVRLLDLDNDGFPELVLGNPVNTRVFAWSKQKQSWVVLPFTLPPGAFVVDRQGRDNGLRFIDLDGDGKLDIIFSNEKEYGIYLFKDMK